MQSYTLIENGFCISLDLSIYARPAVMKALYRYHERYIISFEVDKEKLHVYFEANEKIDNIDDIVASIMKELSYQMIRFDTMKSTNQIRQLLVARALYATCIEEERSVEKSVPVLDQSSWKEDRKNIFSSWGAKV